jgi:Xaa-Pro aminopeptidase
VLTQPDSIAWLLNVRGGDVARTPLPLSFAVLHVDATVDWCVDPAKRSTALAAHLGNAVTLHPMDAFGDLLDALGARGAGVQVSPETSAAWVVERLTDAGAELVRSADPVTALKARKNPVEIAGSRAAHARDGAALARFLAWLDRETAVRPVGEIEAAERLASLRAEGTHFRDLSFDTISGSGSHGAIVHYRVTPRSDRLLLSGELYLVDSGAQYLDGTTDVTRTVAIGAPGDEMRERFTLVLKGHIAVATARFPAGTTGAQLDTLARQFLWRAGLDYDHGTGHGVGSYLGVHEGPQRISKLGTGAALEPGMIVSNEPGYYKAGEYGIRIENLVAVVEAPPVAGGEKALLEFETLTLAPIDRRLVATSLLTGDERTWLDAYHARVRATIGPRLDAATRAWLEQATAAV